MHYGINRIMIDKLHSYTLIVCCVGSAQDLLELCCIYVYCVYCMFYLLYILYIMCSLAVALFGVSKLDLLHLKFSLRPIPVIQVEIYETGLLFQGGLRIVGQPWKSNFNILWRCPAPQVGEDVRRPLEKQEESAWAGSHFLLVLAVVNCER